MEKKPSKNKLRTVILQQVENQTVVGGELEKKEKVVEGEVAGEDEGELDF
jgi:hypothetical protein